MPARVFLGKKTQPPVIGVAYTMTTKRDVHWSEQTKEQNKGKGICQFEAAAWGQGALGDSGPSGCKRDYKLDGKVRKHNGTDRQKGVQHHV